LPEIIDIRRGLVREGEGEPVIVTMAYGERTANVKWGEEHEKKKKKK
jgi:hypothetical protein